MLEQTGILDKLYVDGKVYAVPHATLANFSPVDTPVSHQTIYYRADWMEELGLELFDQTTTPDELRAFLELAIEKDMAANGKTLGLMGWTSDIFRPVLDLYNTAWDRFKVVDGQYVWGPTMDGTIQGIQAVRDLYQSGLVSPDFHMQERMEIRGAFSAGLGAALSDSGGITNVQWIIDAAIEAGEIPDPFDNIKLTILTDEADEWNGPVSTNYWSLHMFSPTIDPAVFERLLMMMDYTCTEEGEVTSNLGVIDVDWDYAPDGSIRLLRAPDENGDVIPTRAIYPSWQFLYLLGVLPDDFSFVSPINDARVIDAVSEIYKKKVESTKLLPVDYDFTFHASDAHAKYVPGIIPDEITRLIIEENIDVESEWNTFISNNQPIWEPLLNELNAEFGQ
jgi:putative aldouronate transport system substrate-binding protein